MAKSGKDKKKNKGPRGKKARRKAKLEKQWGEEREDGQDGPGKYRKGKSRLSNGSKRRVQFSLEDDWNDNGNDTGRDGSEYQAMQHKDVENGIDTDDDDDDDEAQAEMEEDPQAFQQFLKRLSKARKGSEMTNNDDDDDDDDDDDASKGGKFDDDNDDHTDDDDDDDDKDERLSESIDLFSAHFGAPSETVASADDPQASDRRYQILPSLSRSVVVESSKTLGSTLKSTLGLGTESLHANPQKAWKRAASSCLDSTHSVLRENWQAHRGQQRPLSKLQTTVLPSLWSYSDTLVTTENAPTTERLVAMHILNHILTSQQIKRSHDKQAKALETAAAEREERMANKQDTDMVDDEAGDDAEEDVDDNVEADKREALRDQGFTRASVLVLLPTRGVCHTFVNMLLDLLGDEATVEHKERFDMEYGPPPDDEVEYDEHEARRRKVQKEKGKAWNELFGDTVNTDDDFKVSLSIGSKRTKDNPTGLGVRMYTNFYKSDVILASPLALKLATDEDSDYLSSIEVCVLSRVDVMLMQNWDRVSEVLPMLNSQPTSTHSTDFSRVRHYLLDGKAVRWRQLIMLSGFHDALINAAFKRYAQSRAGSMKVRRVTSDNEAALNDVVVPVRQVFQRIPCDSFRNQSEARVVFFAEKILPQIVRKKQKHTMIYIPSYFDFVSIRNILLKRNADFVSVTEYARVSEVSRGRARFLQGRKNILLYTGRAHFFSRHNMKGCRHLIFVGLPEHADFYSQITNTLNEEQSDGEALPVSCLSLFTKFEVHALERIVGKKTTQRMVKGAKSSFMFMV